MFEPTQHQFDDDVDASKKMFERAQVGEVASIDPASVRHVLLVLDGSSQDALSIEIARYCKNWFSCRVSVLDARESVPSNELGETVAGELDAEAAAKPAGESFDQILTAREATSSDLMIVPCPYGRNLESIGPDSTGTAIDVLLARSPVPLLVVRQPYEVQTTIFSRVLLILIGENPAASTAARWAAAFVAHSGSVEMVLVLEEEFYENVRDLMQAVDPKVQITPEALSAALLNTHIRLHLGLQKTAAALDFSYDLSVHREKDVSGEMLGDGPQHPLAVLALERGDHASEGHVMNRIRRSANPLLIVPSQPE